MSLQLPSPAEDLDDDDDDEFDDDDDDDDDDDAKVVVAHPMNDGYSMTTTNRQLQTVFGCFFIRYVDTNYVDME